MSAIFVSYGKGVRTDFKPGASSATSVHFRLDPVLAVGAHQDDVFPPNLEQTKERIQSLAGPVGWDGQGGAAITEPTVEAALDLLWQLAKEAKMELPSPDVTPTPDGSIGLEWRAADRYLAVECEPSGEISFLVQLKGRDEIEQIATSASDLWKSTRDFWQ